MDQAVDHVVYADRDIERLRDAFASVGLDPTYGGEHSNGVTHNYTVGFEDGSYVELISKLDPDAESPWWDRQIDGDAGPAAWALYVEDIEAETDRVADLGVAVDGPRHYQRERPDGTLIEWDLTVVGEAELGTVVPFLVSDRTPREDRVNVDDELAATSLVGVVEVVVGVADVDEHVDTYRSLFDCGEPSVTEHEAFDARLARFEGAPATLAEPRSPSSWLDDRIAEFGALPCAYLVGTTDVAATVDRFDLSGPVPWFDDEVRWFDLPLSGRVGVVDGVP